jgi:hypothetical protein
LNETLAALPDDTNVYVGGINFIFRIVCANDLSSPATSTPRATSNSASRSCSQSLSRSSRLSPTRTSKHRASSLLAMRRYVAIESTFKGMAADAYVAETQRFHET